MQFLQISSLLALTATLANGYTLTFYTDDACTEGATDRSAPDFPEGVWGGCTNTGIPALSFEFFPDVLGGSQQQNMGVFFEENDQDCQNGVYPNGYDAFYQSGDATCIRSIDSPLLNGNPIESFIVGGNDPA